MKVRFTLLAGVLAISAGLLTGCQSEESAGGAAATEVPPATGAQPMGAGDGITPPAGTGVPAMPVAPTQTASVRTGAPPKTSFDAPPEGMPGVNPATPGGQPGGGGGLTPAPSAGGPAVASAKPKPIVEGKASKFRPDPFVSFVRFFVEKPPAYTLAVPDRLAAYPKYTPPPTPSGVENMLPLPPVPRRVAGVLYNGAITAILETGEPPASESRIISPGAKVPSGIPGIPELTVDSIAMDRLVLRAEDGRTVEVKLSGLSPAVLQSMQSQFGGGGGGGFTGGSGMMGPGGGGGGAAAGGGSGGAVVK